MTRVNRLSKQRVRQRRKDWLSKIFEKEAADTMEFLNSPVTDREVTDVIRRLSLLPDPSGTNQDAAALLERLCCELAEMRERASALSRAISAWSDEFPNS